MSFVSGLIFGTVLGAVALKCVQIKIAEKEKAKEKEPDYVVEPDATPENED